MNTRKEFGGVDHCDYDFRLSELRQDRDTGESINQKFKVCSCISILIYFYSFSLKLSRISSIFVVVLSRLIFSFSPLPYFIISSKLHIFQLIFFNPGPHQLDQNVECYCYQ